VKLVTCISLMLKLGISGTILPLSHMPLWWYSQGLLYLCLWQDRPTVETKQNKYDENKNDNDDDNNNNNKNKNLQGGVCGMVWLSQSHHKVTRKMAMLHCHPWGVFGMCWYANFSAIISHLKVAHPRCVFDIIRSIINSNTKIYFQNQVSNMFGLIFNHHQAKLEEMFTAAWIWDLKLLQK